MDIDDAIEKLKPTTDIEIIPQDAWANKYDTGHFQEYHTHEVPYCNLSIVYICMTFLTIMMLGFVFGMMVILNTKKQD